MTLTEAIHITRQILKNNERLGLLTSREAEALGRILQEALTRFQKNIGGKP